jgi:hypothetical protein
MKHPGQLTWKTSTSITLSFSLSMLVSNPWTHFDTDRFGAFEPIIAIIDYQLILDILVSISLQKLPLLFEILLYARSIVWIMSKLPIMVFVATILVTSFGILTIPAASALIQRNYSYGFNDNHITARYGNTLVCGDHMCAPGEWDKLQAKLTAAQLGYQGGRNATQTTTTPPPSTVPSAPTAPSSTTMPTGVTPKLCGSVKIVLASSGVSPSVITQVMADLGCS